MIQILKTKRKYALAVNVVEGFTEEDERYCEELFEKKLKKHERVNLLIKVDELKLRGSSVTAFWKDLKWILKNYKKIGHLAIVAHSKILKAWIKLDNLIFRNLKAGRHELYFDTSEMNLAMDFINSKG